MWEDSLRPEDPIWERKSRQDRYTPHSLGEEAIDAKVRLELRLVSTLFLLA